MKKSLKLVISLVLCLAVVLSFASCSLFYWVVNDGYTGGFPNEPHFYGGNEIYWLETYAEAMEAIEHLEAYDNVIEQGTISSYENEIVDAKYCIIVYTSGSKRLKKGQKWYDHKYSQVTVSYYGFLDKITIEELEHSDINYYRYFTVGNIKDKEVDTSKELSYRCETYKNENGTSFTDCEIVEKETGLSLVGLGYNNIADHCAVLPENFHEEFVETVVFIS